MTPLSWKTEKRKIKDLVPADYNPRQMTEAQAKQLRKSIEKFNLVEIPAIDQDNTILAGHQRMSMLLTLGRGEEEIDVRVPNRKLTDAEAKEYNLRSNKNTGEWDMDKLFAMPDGLLEEVGFDKKEIQKLIDGNTEVTEDDYDVDKGLETPVRVELGEIWQLGEHRLMCGDSTKVEDVGTLMDGMKADMVFTDPPYNVAGQSVNFAADVSKSMNDLKNSKWDVDFNVFDVTSILQSVVSENSTTYIFTSHFLFGDLYTAYRDWSDFVSYCVWNKPNPMPSLSKRHWTFNTELCLYATKGKWICNFPNGEHALSGWIFTKKSDGSHPTQKPLEVCEHAIKFSSNDNHIVLDLFGGSGSTLIACEQTNRKCYMMELDPKYCTVILDRWEKLTGKKANKLS